MGTSSASRRSSGRDAAPEDPVAPRLPPELDVVDAAQIGDEGDWVGLEVRGEVTLETDQLDIEECHLVGIVLAGQLLERFRGTDVVFEDCDLSGVDVERLDLLRVRFEGCRMRGIVAPSAQLRDVLVDGCTLDGAALRMARGERVAMTGCSLRGLDLTGSVIEGARLEHSDLTDADLSAVRLPGGRLVGSTLEGLRGGESLRDVVIDSSQVHPLALQVFRSLGIVVDEGAAGGGVDADR
jgi:uncharacterized protein YjbI with pentapeptide repeats